MRKICIIQARLGSKRLPKKVFLKINEKTILYWVIARAKKVDLFNQIVLAVPKKDIKLQNYIKKNFKRISLFCGSENDVLKRYYLAAKKFKADIITRITADDPLKDVKLIKDSLKYFIRSDLDYYSNSIYQTYPIGLDIEHFSFSALSKANKMAKKTYDREHVTPFIKNNPKIFKIKNFRKKKIASKIRFTVDTKKDYAFMKYVFKKIKKDPYMDYRKIIKKIS